MHEKLSMTDAMAIRSGKPRRAWELPADIHRRRCGLDGGRFSEAVCESESYDGFPVMETSPERVMCSYDGSETMNLGNVLGCQAPLLAVAPYAL